MSKKESQKKGAVSEIQKNVSNALEKIKDSEKEHKAELDPLKIEHANEVQMNENQKCYLIQVSTPNLAGFKKVHSLLTKKLEEHLSSNVMIIPARKRVNGKEYRTYVSKKVPRDKTLTAVFDGYLDDILYPATIVGKRVRYPVGKTRIYKVIVDPLDKESVEESASIFAFSHIPIEINGLMPINDLYILFDTDVGLFNISMNSSFDITRGLTFSSCFGIKYFFPGRTSLTELMA